MRGNGEHSRKSHFPVDIKDMINWFWSYREIHCPELKSTSPMVPQLRHVVGSRPRDLMVDGDDPSDWTQNQPRDTPLGGSMGYFLQGLIPPGVGRPTLTVDSSPDINRLQRKVLLLLSAGLHFLLVSASIRCGYHPLWTAATSAFQCGWKTRLGLSGY